MHSKVLRTVEGGGLSFFCPGCQVRHVIWHGAGAPPRWGWNGDMDKPTFTPSILVRYSCLSQAAADRDKAFHEKHGRHMSPEELPYDEHHVCHSYVAGGRIQFLGDCTHALANQTVDLPDWSSP